MKNIDEQVEEFEDYLAPLLGYVIDDGEWKIYGIGGVLERPAHTNDLNEAVEKHKQALLTAEKRERERIEDAFASKAKYKEDFVDDGYGNAINTSCWQIYEGDWEKIITQPNNK